MNDLLPEDQSLDISAFTQILDKTTNSYKYLFFLSIIRIVKSSSFSNQTSLEIKFIDIAVEMLLIAWFPHRYFKLSLGSQDQCAEILNIFLNAQNRVFENGPITNSNINVLKHELFEWLFENKNYLNKLLRYVPYRLLTPFYSLELRGLPDAHKNDKIKLLTNNLTNESMSLYKILDDSIIIDWRWEKYIHKNMPIIEGWVKWSWCEYLQNRNLSVPSIPKKILPILGRESMSKEISYWRGVLKHNEFKCLYSSKGLDSFELDHFLPWTFVTHNKLWNLLPVLGSANSSKSNNLPSLSYLDQFIEIQSVAIKVSKNIYPEIKWRKFMESHIFDLKINSYNDLLDDSILDKAYRSTICPLYEIAEANGFSAGWVYKINNN